ncbi:SPOR domain-containing protein [Bartonella sp. B23]
MSDNDRKNPREIKQDHERHDPLDRLTRIFNPNKQSGNQNDQSSLQTDRSIPSAPKTSSYNDDFDLSFIEAELENSLKNDLFFDDQKEQWSLHTTGDESTSDSLPTAFFNRSEQNRFLPEEKHSSAVGQDEEKILDALSPLPIQKSQLPKKGMAPIHTDPFFEKRDLSERSENLFFDEADKYDNPRGSATESLEQDRRFSQTTLQQKNAPNTQRSHDGDQNFHNSPVNHPYKVSADQENRTTEYYSDLSPSFPDTNVFPSSSDFVSERRGTAKSKMTTGFPSPLDSTQINKQSDLEGFSRESHTTNYPHFYEEEFSKQETYAKKTPEYYGTQAKYAINTENIPAQNNEKEIPYNQSNLNYMHSTPQTLDTENEEVFFAHSTAHRGDAPPPSVDTYKFAEEVVEKTGPIMVPEVPYEAPEYGVLTDDLKEEFSDVLNVGNVPREDFSRQQQENNEIFNEIFHQTMENPKEDVYRNSQDQNASYFPTKNMEYHSPKENPLYRSTDEISTHGSNTPSFKNFIVGKTFVRSVIFLTLVTVGFFGYFHFFMPSQKNENSPIIYADDRPFKFKQKTSESKNDVAHNLDIYRQTTGQDKKQENTQQSLIDDSEQPEDLMGLNQQKPTSFSSSSFNQSDVEDAVTEAINHTVPTREVQTVIVNKDGTVVLAPRHYTEKKTTNKPEKMIDQTAVDQPQDFFSVSSYNSDVDDKETEHTFASDIDKIITESTSTPHVEEKVIPLSLHAERNSELQRHANPLPPSPDRIATQNSEDYYVQLASQPTHALARDSLKSIKSKFGFLIGARPLNIQSALIPGKGTYYRVRIRMQNRNDAISLCEDIKNSGGNCFVTR